MSFYKLKQTLTKDSVNQLQQKKVEFIEKKLNQSLKDNIHLKNRSTQSISKQKSFISLSMVNPEHYNLNSSSQKYKLDKQSENRKNPAHGRIFLQTNNHFLQNEAKANDLQQLNLTKSTSNILANKKQNLMIQQLKSKNQMSQTIIKQLEIKIKRLQQQLNITKTSSKHKQSELQQKLIKYQIQIQVLNHYNIQLLMKNSTLQTLQQNKLLEPTPKTQSQKFKQLGYQYQLKINQLYDQNYKLKNQLILNQSKLEQQQTKNKSLQMIIQAFQKRDHQQNDNTQYNIVKEELEKLRQEKEALYQANFNLISQYQMNLIKLQNQATQSYFNQNVKKLEIKYQNDLEQLRNTVKDQINQILRLKQKNKKTMQLISLKNK